MRGLDIALFRALNGVPDWLAPVFVFLSEGNKQTVGRVLLVAMILGLLGWKKTRKATILALLAWPLANGLTEIAKTIVPWPRPSADPGLAELGVSDAVFRVNRLTSFGTASSHAANWAAIAWVFLAIQGRMGWFFVALAVLIGVSRVVVGVHYPYQVMLGWLAGAWCGFLVVESYRAWLRLRTPRTNEPSDAEPTV